MLSSSGWIAASNSTLSRSKTACTEQILAQETSSPNSSIFKLLWFPTSELLGCLRENSGSRVSSGGVRTCILLDHWYFFDFGSSLFDYLETQYDVETLAESTGYGSLTTKGVHHVQILRFLDLIDENLEVKNSLKRVCCETTRDPSKVAALAHPWSE